MDGLGPNEGVPLRVREVELEAGDDGQRYREKLARIVLDEMYQFVGLLDTEGRLLEVNRAALEGGGIQLCDIQGKPFWEAPWWKVSRTTQEQLKEAVRRAASGEFIRYDVEVFGAAHGSETIVIDFSIIPVRDHSGEVVFLLPEGRNITEKKRVQEEVARKNRELEALLVRVRELDELKSQFFANVSHELRTPLALILGPAEKLLERTPLGDPLRRDLETIRRNATTLLKEVNALLDLSKLDAGKMALRYEETDLASRARMVAAHFESIAEERGVSYVLDVVPSLPAQIDGDKVDRVLLNLLANAFKFAPAGGLVKLLVVPTTRDRALLSVQDDGPGVPAALRGAIFERFRQGDAGATRRHGGTGLGLSIARDFVDLHGGIITVTEAAGGGALFQVELPTRAPPGAAVHRAQALAGLDATTKGTLEELRPAWEWSAVTTAGAVHSHRVLVVEDNAEMGRYIAECLADEMAVDLAHDGREGLQKALDHPPDLIVTDIMMPGASGDQLLSELRSRREFDNVPVLVLSARADDRLRVTLLRHGAQDYLVKPFSADELRARTGNLVSVKRARELLQAELESTHHDLVQLARDVTQRSRELQTALEATRAARQEVEQASKVKDTFLSLVSHELRTPLTTIHLQVQRLEATGFARLSEGQRAILQRISLASERLLELVESLLEYTRISAGRLPVRGETLDPRPLLEKVLQLLRPRAERKGLELRLVCDASLAPFASDSHLVKVVFSNLVDNAIKFTGHGYVEVSARTEEGALVVAVSDSGSGIAAGDQARIFEPFVQLAPVVQKHQPGFGIGLSIVRQVVEALGGEIAVRSDVGQGTSFTVRLPPFRPEDWPGHYGEPSQGPPGASPAG